MPRPLKKVPRIINRRLPNLASRGNVKRPEKQRQKYKHDIISLKFARKQSESSERLTSHK